MIGSVVAPLIVQGDPANIPLLNTVLPSLAAAGFLLTWLSVNTSQPPSPPSPSAEALGDKEAETLGKHSETTRTPPVLSVSQLLTSIVSGRF